MTREEAKKVLSAESCYECSYGCNSPTTCGNPYCIVKEATVLAIASIEKQIPKKPICIKDSATTKHFNCPVCAYRFVSEIDGQLCAGRKTSFCPDCGQAIDWRAGNGET